MQNDPLLALHSDTHNCEPSRGILPPNIDTPISFVPPGILCMGDAILSGGRMRKQQLEAGTLTFPSLYASRIN